MTTPFAACGLSPSLFTERGDGTAQREGWRRAVFGVISPLGRMVESEFRTKLDEPGLRLVWDELRASDLLAFIEQRRDDLGR